MLIETEPIHLIIYCLKMTETRICWGIVHTFEQYTKIGIKWRKTAIALTFADALQLPSKVKKQKGFSESAYFKERLALWRMEITRAIAAEIHFEETDHDVARIRMNSTTGDHEEKLPDGDEW